MTTLQLAVVNITNACVNNCPGCFAPKQGEELDLSDAYMLLNKFAEHDIDVTYSGGEPFMYSQLPKLLGITHEINGKPGIFTSGLYKLLDLDYELDDLVEHIGFVNLTMKFPDHGYNDRFFGNQGLTKAAYWLMRELDDLSIPVNIQFAVDRRNYPHFKMMKRMAYEHNANLHVIRFMPFGEGQEEVAFTDQEWEGFVEEVYAYDGVQVMFPSHRTYQECVAGITRLLVHTNCDVSPCLYLPDMRVANLNASKVCANKECQTPILQEGEDVSCRFCGSTEYEYRELTISDLTDILHGWRETYPRRCCVANARAWGKPLPMENEGKKKNTFLGNIFKTVSPNTILKDGRGLL